MNGTVPVPPGDRYDAEFPGAAVVPEGPSFRRPAFPRRPGEKPE